MTYPLEEHSRGSGFKIQGTTSTNIPIYRVMHLNGSGEWTQANAGAAATMPATGLSCEAINTRKGTVLLNGLIINKSWSWTPGGLLYVSKTEGVMTQTPPAVTGDKVQIVGRAITTTLVVFNPDFYLTTA